jgi:hypothetical protein
LFDGLCCADTQRVQKRAFFAVAIDESLHPTVRQVTYQHPAEANIIMECLPNCVCDFVTNSATCCHYSPSIYNVHAVASIQHVKGTGDAVVCELVPQVDQMIFRTRYDANVLFEGSPAETSRLRFMYDRSIRNEYANVISPVLLPSLSIADVIRGGAKEGVGVLSSEQIATNGEYVLLVCFIKAIDVCFSGAQTAFGPSSNTPNRNDASSTDYSLFDWIDQQRRHNQTAVVPTLDGQSHTTSRQTSIAQNYQYRILLIGGSWESWSSIRWLVNVHTLAFITHVGDTTSGGSTGYSFIEASSTAVGLVLGAGGVIYGHPNTAITPEHDNNMDVVAKNKERIYTYSGHDVLWPIVLARKLNIPIHFVVYNEVLVQSAYNIPALSNAPVPHSRTAKETRQMLHQSGQEADTLIGSIVFRLSGFASVRSSVQVLGVCPNSELYRSLKGMSDGPSRSEQASLTDYTFEPLLFQVVTSDFRVATDGQLCLFLGTNELRRKLLACYVGPTVAIRFEFNVSGVPSLRDSNRDRNRKFFAAVCDQRIVQTRRHQHQSSRVDESHEYEFIGSLLVDFVLRGTIYINELHKHQEYICLWRSRINSDMSAGSTTEESLLRLKHETMKTMKVVAGHNVASDVPVHCITTIVSDFGELTPYTLFVPVSSEDVVIHS